METNKERPRDLSEEEVNAASEGRSEEAFGKTKPVALTEEEVAASSEGRSDELEGKKKGN